MFAKYMRTRRLRRRGGQTFWQRLTGKRKDELPAKHHPVPVTHVINKAYDTEGKIAELSLKFEQFREMILKAFKLTDTKVQAFTHPSENGQITELFNRYDELNKYTRSSISHLGRLVQAEIVKLKKVEQPLTPEIRGLVGDLVGQYLDELSSRIEDVSEKNDQQHGTIMGHLKEFGEELQHSYQRQVVLAERTGIQMGGRRR
jgi:hypothetical protein